MMTRTMKPATSMKTKGDAGPSSQGRKAADKMMVAKGYAKGGRVRKPAVNVNVVTAAPKPRAVPVPVPVPAGAGAMPPGAMAGGPPMDPTAMPGMKRGGMAKRAKGGMVDEADMPVGGATRRTAVQRRTKR